MTTEKVKKRRNTLYLPEYLLVDILSRVPETSLARFQSTSKGWNALIKRDGRLVNNSLFVMVIYIESQAQEHKLLSQTQTLY